MPASSREAARQGRRDEILKVSWSVFATEGSSGFSMRKVAQALGVRLNTVQYYYGDLNSLLLETIRLGLERYTLRYRLLAVDTRLTPQKRLEAVVEDMLREANDPTAGGIAVELWVLAQRNEQVRQLVQEMYAEVINSLALISRDVDPAQSPAEAQAVATMLTAMAEGTVVLSRSGALAAPASKRFNSAARLACNSLFRKTATT